MPHLADLRDYANHCSPFSIAKEIGSFANDFDPDEEVEIHMQSEDFKTAFSYRQAIDDFEAWKEKLVALSDSVSETLNVFVQHGLTEDDCKTAEFTLAALLEEIE